MPITGIVTYRRGVAMAQEHEIHFRYRKAEDYRLVSATGIYGGITPNGRIFANLFVDHPQMPETVTHRVSPDSRLGEEIGRTEGDADGSWFDRRLEVGVLMDPSVARSVGRWLIQKADEFDEQAKEAAKG